MLNEYKPTHDPNQDTFRVEYLLGGAAVLGVLFPYKYTMSEILWAFSIWLESVAILPQLFMLQRTGSADTITTHYIFALGAYRALYIPNWIWRYVHEDIGSRQGGVGADGMIAGTLRKAAILMRLLSLLDWFKRCSTRTSSTSTGRRSCRARSSICQCKLRRARGARNVEKDGKAWSRMAPAIVLHGTASKWKQTGVSGASRRTGYPMAWASAFSDA